jgi:hypothetical protein
MAFAHGRNGRVYINGFDISAFLKQAGGGVQVTMLDTTAFGTIDDMTFIPGLKKGALKMNGMLDETAVTGIGTLLEAAFGAANSIFTLVPASGDVIGSPCYGFSANLGTYNLDTSLGGLGKLDADATSNYGGFERLIIHHALTTEVATATGAAQDNGASSANGGVGFLQVPDITGITALDVVIQDSADGSTGWATILTFTSVTADRAKQRVAITGTVRRFTRYVATFTGTGSAQFHVGFGRK